MIYFVKKNEGSGVASLITAPSHLLRVLKTELACCWRGELTKYLNKGSGEKDMLRLQREIPRSYGLGVLGTSIIAPIQHCHF